MPILEVKKLRPRELIKVFKVTESTGVGFWSRTEVCNHCITLFSGGTLPAHVMYVNLSYIS